jgi:hypothetical protein
MTNFSQLLSVPMEWCASPKGCYKTVDPATGESVTSNGQYVQPGGESADTNPLQDIINKSIDYAISASFSELLKFVLIIAGIIVAFVFIKKLMRAGVDKVSSMDLKTKAHETAKAHLREKQRSYEAQLERIAEEKKAKLQAKLHHLHQEGELDDTTYALQEVLEDGMSFYQKEIAELDRIQKEQEASLNEDYSLNAEKIDMHAGDLTLQSLRKYSKETKELFNAVDPSKLFEEFNRLEEQTFSSYSGDVSDLMEADLKNLDPETKRKMARGLLGEAFKHNQ